MLLRSVALVAAIASGIAMFAWTVKGGSWLAGFLQSNALEKAQRATIIKSMAGAIGVGSLVVTVAFAVQWFRRRAVTNLERWLWFLLPVALLPAFPIFFRSPPWVGRGAVLLPLLACFGFLLEGVLARSFAHTPGLISRAQAFLLRVTPRPIKRHGWLITVVLASVGLSSFLAYHTCLSHFSLHTRNFDTSINNNLMYGMASGLFNQSPVALGDQADNYLAAHAKFGLYIYTPLYALRPRAETLFIIQAFSTGLTAIPIFLLARRYVAQWMAALVALCYLSYHPIHASSFFELKPLEFALVYIALTAYFVDTKRWVWATLSFLITMLMRDDLPVAIAVIGAVFAFSGYRARFGFFMASVASLWFFVLRFMIMGDKGDWWFPSMFDELFPPGEKGFGPVAKTLVTNPVFTFKTLISEAKIHYILHIFMPLAFLPLRRAFTWVIFIPGMLFSLLTTGYKPTITYSFHYVLHWAALVFIATPFVLRSIEKQSGKAKASAAALTMLMLTAITSFQWGAFPQRNTLVGGYTRIDFEYNEKDKKRYEQLMSLAWQIPVDADVSATESVGPHVSSRVKLYAIRLRWGKQMGEYVLLSTRELKLEKTEERLAEILSSGSHGLHDRAGEFLLLRRGANTAKNAALIAELRLKPKAAPKPAAPKPAPKPEETPDENTEPEGPAPTQPKPATPQK